MISVIILTLNSIKFIKPCLDSILSQKVDKIEIIVVDNGSKDRTVSLLKENYPQVRLVENTANLGAAKARNQGIEVAHGEWILTLDCDVVLNKDFFDNINNALKDLDPSISSLQPKILESGKKTIYSAGIFVSFLRRFHDIGKGQRDIGKFNKSVNIFGACSAAALYRKSSLNEINQGGYYFDERFFFLFEDVDLSWRLQSKRYKALFYPSAVAYHQGDSSETPKKLRQYLCLRNRYYTLIKNDSMKNYILPFLFYDFPRLIWLLVINPHALRAIKDAFVYKKEINCIGK